MLQRFKVTLSLCLWLLILNVAQSVIASSEIPQPAGLVKIDQAWNRQGPANVTTLATLQSKRSDTIIPGLDSWKFDASPLTGDKCFAYTGHCIKLDDQKAMSDACGKDFTVVGWDDAGCGTRSCHCGKPICCPVNTAPKQCKWRGDGNGHGVSSDCSAQCLPGEINIHGISSRWGGGFSNDGNTNQCGRGRKVFCCEDPDYQKTTNQCHFTNCGEECPHGTYARFGAYNQCKDAQVKSYCCPDTTLLNECRWTSGEGEKDCGNAVCRADEVELDRNRYGGTPGTPWNVQLNYEAGNRLVNTHEQSGCDWDRQRVACCKVYSPGPDKSKCDIDICKDPINQCSDTWDDDADIQARDISHNISTKHLEARGVPYKIQWLSGGILLLASMPYPRPSDLFRGPNGRDVARLAWTLNRGSCDSDHSVDCTPLNLGLDGAPIENFSGMNTEHPIDRNLMAEFIRDSVNGRLRDQPITQPAPLPESFFQNHWTEQNERIYRQPGVGGANGPSYRTVRERVMAALGSSDFREPLMLVQGRINRAKAHMMKGESAVDLKRIEDAARNSHTDAGARTETIELLRLGISPWEYLFTPEAAHRFNAARRAVREQLGYAQQVFNTGDIVEWWDLWMNDRLRMIEERAHAWATEAFELASEPAQAAITESQRQGREPPQALLEYVKTLSDLLQQFENSCHMPSSSS